MVRPFNTCVCGCHSFVTLTRGFVCLVSPEDVAELSKWSWSATVIRRTAYARRNIGKRPNRQSLPMHKDILCPDGDQIVDHIDGNGLNNCRENLRLCTNIENQRNQRRRRKNATSEFKGVHFDRRIGRWRARITINGRLKHLGDFKNEINAAHTYDAAAKRYFGEFAAPNFEDK